LANLDHAAWQPNEQLQRLVALRCDARRLRFHISLRGDAGAIADLDQTRHGPERYVLSIRFETMPSTASRRQPNFDNVLVKHPLQNGHAGIFR
jgi:hypothetical protein